MPYYYSSSDSIAIYLISAIIGLVVSIVFGCITKGINENKGYDGGFAWGFWLGWIGIIVVACRQPCVYTPTESIIVPAKNAVQAVSAPPGKSTLPAVGDAAAGASMPVLSVPAPAVLVSAKQLNQLHLLYRNMIQIQKTSLKTFPFLKNIKRFLIPA